MKRWLNHILLLFISIQTFGFSQFTISGRVLDDLTGQPIEIANVFLSKTTLGTTSDKEGDFYLKNITPGKYELVVSVMGYAIQKRVVRVEGPGKLDLQFRLKQQVIAMPSITVTATDQRQRIKDLKKFKLAFLGNTNNALETKIINEYIIIFTHNKKKLFARTDAPLIVENRGLGYEIEYSLEHFELDPTYVKYAGDSKFEELTPKDQLQAHYWDQNRKIAYLGSLQHFLTILCKTYSLDRKSGVVLEKDIRMESSPLYNRLQPPGSMTQEAHYLARDGFNVYLIDNLYNLKTSKEDRLENPNILLSPSARPNEMVLKFDNYLKIEFFEENEDRTFLRDRGIFRHPGPQVSWISLMRDSVFIDQLGRYHDPMFMLQKGGYMAWERIADMMPADYKPLER